MQVDMRLITLLLVIDLGNREGGPLCARRGSEMFLSQWSSNSAEPR